jgi:hypothetical protein
VCSCSSSICTSTITITLTLARFPLYVNNHSHLSHTIHTNTLQTVELIIIIIIIIIIIQWRNSPLQGEGHLTVRFLDHAEGLLRWAISSLQGGQAITLHKLLIIPDPPTRVLWQLDQKRHPVAKQGIGQEIWPLNFAYRASLRS